MLYNHSSYYCIITISSISIRLKTHYGGTFWNTCKCCHNKITLQRTWLMIQLNNAYIINIIMQLKSNFGVILIQLLITREGR